MPYHVGEKGSYGCSGYPAVDAEGTVMGCHETAEEAANQIYAINVSEGNVEGDKSLGIKNPEKWPIKNKSLVAKMESTEDEMKEWESLNPRQQALAEDLAEMALEYGMFDQTSGANGSHYAPGNLNPFKDSGMVCKNCIFYYEETEQCMIVAGQIGPDDICKFWVIPEDEIMEPGSEDGMEKRAGGKFPSSIGQPEDASTDKSVIKDPKVKPKRSIGGVGTAGVGAQKADEDVPDSDLFSGFGKDFTRVERRTEVFLPNNNE